MAWRSVRVVLRVRIYSDFVLVRDDANTGLDHGIWTDKPPDFVGNDEVNWGSESNGFLTGTAGFVTYTIPHPGSGDGLRLRLEWSDPFFGSNSYGATVTPQGQSDGSGFSVGFFGGGGDNALVTFVLLSGKCYVDPSSGETVCTIVQGLGEQTPGQRYAAIWEKRGGFSWQARHGLSSAQYQQAFDQLLREGYRPIQVSGYTINGEDRYAAIWEQRIGLPWQARHELSSAQYQQTFDQLVGEGYRLVHVSGYEVRGEDRYAAIWEQRGGPPWQARHGLSSAQYQQTFDQLLSEGYRPIQVSGYGLKGEERYAAIWEKRESPGFQARHGLSATQYQQTFDQLVSEGYRLVDVSGYEIKGQDRYAAIWEERTDWPWQARHGLDSAHYQQAFDELIRQGYRLVRVSGYNVNI